MSLGDALDLFGSGPAEPAYAQMLRDLPAADIALLFGAEDAGSRFDGLRVAAADREVYTPFSSYVRRVPDLAALSAEDRRAVLDPLPVFRRIDGSALPVSDLETDDLLLEVWPAAYRRITYLWAMLEAPGAPGEVQPRTPRMPVPRWIVVRGVSSTSRTSALQDEIAAQFPDIPASDRPDLTLFDAGRDAVLLGAATLLGHARSDAPLEIRMFDEAGLPICPNAVFGTIALAAAAPFPVSYFARPDVAGAAWAGPARQVYVLSDHAGAPYVPWADPDEDARPGSAVAPDRGVVIAAQGGPDTPLDIPEHGILALESGDSGYIADADTLVDLTVPGDHTRLGLHPDGQLGTSARWSARAHAFLRVRVIDWLRWFPARPGAGATPYDPMAAPAALSRYTEGNEYVPMADGETAFREIYRAIRRTYRDETYPDLDSMPDGPARADLGEAQVFLLNWGIDPTHPLLPRRAMLSTPRVQDSSAIPEDFDALAGSFVAIRVLPLPGTGTTLDDAVRAPEDTATDLSSWAWVARPGALPPGTWLLARPLEASVSFSGDDPRKPGVDQGADLYGLVTSREDRAEGFVGNGGQAAVLLRLDPDTVPAGVDGLPAMLRIGWWEAEDDDSTTLETSGRGVERVRDLGSVTLPVPMPPPPPPSAPPEINPDAGGTLVWGGAPGLARLELEPGFVLSPSTLAIINTRTGGVTLRSVAPDPAVLSIELSNVAMADRLLLGVLGSGETDMTTASVLYLVQTTVEQRASGLAPLHPKELGGLLREAVAAGVDVRAMPWENALESAPLATYVGFVQTMTTLVDGRRAQSFADPFNRPAGSHHQKPAFIRDAEGVTAFVGGLDLTLPRWDRQGHADPIGDRAGGLWHDIHVRIRGRAAWDVHENFRQRWNGALAALTTPDAALTPVSAVSSSDGPENPEITLHDGYSAVQINRTIPRGLDHLSTWVDPDLGDLSIVRSYRRAIDEAQLFLHIEDQYFFNLDLANRIHQRLVDGGLQFVFLLLPKQLSEFAPIDMALYAIRRRAVNTLLYGQDEAPADPATYEGSVADRVVVCHPVNADGVPVYVHAKFILADDLWTTIGSSNMNQRSMSYDTEIDAAGIDTRLVRGAHRTARELRVSLLLEHLDLPRDQGPLVEDPLQAFRIVKSALAGEWPGIEPHLVAYDPDHTHYGLAADGFDASFSDAMRLVMDPDGTQASTEVSLIGLKGLLSALAAGTVDQPFGGVGSLRLELEASAVETATGLASSALRARIRVQVDEGAGWEDYLVMSELPVVDRAVVGLLAIGRGIRLEGTLYQADDPSSSLGTASLETTVVDFVTSRTLVFSS